VRARRFDELRRDRPETIHGKQLLTAVKSGEAQSLTKDKLLERLAVFRKTPVPTVALRIPQEDLARKQAEARGLPYQTYIKSFLHETLVDRERRNPNS
jgi:predicted DNA binding CopG/RHH family protein